MMINKRTATVLKERAKSLKNLKKKNTNNSKQTIKNEQINSNAGVYGEHYFCALFSLEQHECLLFVIVTRFHHFTK